MSSPCTLTGFPAAPESSGSSNAGPWKFILLQPQVVSLVAVSARNSFQVTCTYFWHVQGPSLQKGLGFAIMDPWLLLPSTRFQPVQGISSKNTC